MESTDLPPTPRVVALPLLLDKDKFKTSNIFPPDIKSAGFSGKTMKNSGYSASLLRQLGYTTVVVYLNTQKPPSRSKKFMFLLLILFLSVIITLLVTGSISISIS